MNSSALVLIGGIDALIALIQSERDLFCKSFDPQAAIQTLQKVRAEFVQRLLEFTSAQVHASETFRTSTDQLLASLPQGSDLDAVVRTLRATVIHLLPQGPNPPTPSLSSSSSPLGLHLAEELSQLVAGLKRLTSQKPPEQ